MSEQDSKEISELEKAKQHAAMHGYVFSLDNWYDYLTAYDRIREQWFPRIQFIDVHQADAPSITDEDMQFHNDGINPDFQTCNTDIFMYQG